MTRAGRAKLSRLMMVLGIASMVAGAWIRLGAGGLPSPCGSECGPGPTPTSAVALASPSAGPGVTAPPATAAPVATPVPAPTVAPATPTLAPTVAPTVVPEPGALWFGDDFDQVAAWPDGTLDWMTTSVVGGQYRIAAQVTDLPIVVMAAAGEGSPDGSILVAMRLTLPPGTDADAGAGLVLETVAGERLMVIVFANGRVSLLRDSIESLDQLASGTINPPGGPVELALSIGDGDATVVVDGSQVASARAAFAPIGFGIAIWAPLEPATIEVDQYRVWVVGPAPQP